MQAKFRFAPLRRKSLGAEIHAQLLQLRVLRLGLLQDGNVGVGVFPKSQEILIGGEGASVGGVGICALRSFCLHGVGTRHAQMRQRSRPAVPDNAVVVENFLELLGGGTALPSGKICLAAPFMTMSFLALSPIPTLKLTDQGLIDTTKLEKTSLFV